MYSQVRGSPSPGGGGGNEGGDFSPARATSAGKGRRPSAPTASDSRSGSPYEQAASSLGPGNQPSTSAATYSGRPGRASSVGAGPSGRQSRHDSPGSRMRSLSQHSQDGGGPLGKGVTNRPSGSGGPGVVGGSVGLPGSSPSEFPGGPSQRSRSFSGSGAELQGQMKQRPRSISDAVVSNKPEIGKLGGAGGGKPGGSVGLPGTPGGSVGLPGGVPRARSKTEGSPAMLANDRSAASPRMGGGPLDRVRGATVDVGGDEYVPRAGSEAQKHAMGLGSVAYSPLDRVSPLDLEKAAALGAAKPVEVGPPSERDVSLWKLGPLYGAWGYCVLSWLLGVSGPFSRLDVMPGTSLHWKMTRSCLHTLTDLVEHRAWFPFLALSFFSLAVPIGKMSGTFILVRKLTKKRAGDVLRENRLLVNVLGYLASYQFVDLYCGILFVCYFNSEASAAKFEVGFYWFFSYCLVSLACSVVLENILHEAPAHGEDEVQATPLLEQDEPLDSPGGALGEQRPPKAQAAAHGAAPLDGATNPGETFPDLFTTRFFSACYVLMFVFCLWDRFLEVRMLMDGVAVERAVMSLKEVLVDFLPLRVHPVVLVVLWLFLVLFPFAYTAAQLARVEFRHRFQDKQTDWKIMGISVQTLCGTFARNVAEMLRQWAHVDVLAVAALIFLFMIQDDQTLTMTPDGSIAFYVFLAASFSFFFLRWFTEVKIDQRNSWAPNVRFGGLVAVFAALILLLWGGVPGAAPHFQYRSLASVCEHVQPFLHKVTRELPAAVGNCDDKDSNPPQPCFGSENLQTSGDEESYMNAIWMGGLRTMNINSCKLSKVAAEDRIPGESSYRFQIGGKFDHISMFLRVKQCIVAGGCVEMNSADHCCGDDIGFNFTFGLNCMESPGSSNAIRSLKLTDANLGQMLVHEDMYNGALKIQATDISGQVEVAVKSHIEKVLHAEVKWGSNKLSMADMINRIVQYNAPADVGQCL